jgi:hypothetical protein
MVSLTGVPSTVVYGAYVLLLDRSKYGGSARDEKEPDGRTHWFWTLKLLRIAVLNFPTIAFL